MNLIEARKKISNSARNSPDGAIFKLQIKGKDFEQSQFRMIVPEDLLPGDYTLNAFVSIDEGVTWEPHTMLSLEIPKEKMETADNQQSIINSDPLNYIVNYHKQEITRLVNFYEKQLELEKLNHKLELDSLKQTHKVEVGAIEDKYSFKIDILEKNQVEIEKSKRSIRTEVESNLKTQARFAVLNKEEGFSIKDVFKTIVEYAPQIMKVLSSASGNSGLQTLDALIGSESISISPNDMDTVRKIMDEVAKNGTVATS